MSRSKRLAAVLGGIGVIAVLGFAVPFASGGSNGTHGSKAKNVILFIGDGMGDSEVTSGRYYEYGAAGRMNLDKLPITGFQTTWAWGQGPGAWGVAGTNDHIDLFDIISDSFGHGGHH